MGGWVGWWDGGLDKIFGSRETLREKNGTLLFSLNHTLLMRNLPAAGLWPKLLSDEMA